jgi:predicted TIM-barrel fold metal-dependent hydrolase
MKFHCQVLDVNITDIDNPYVISFLKETRLPVLLHSWIRKDKRLSSNVFALAEKYPEIRFCIAHMWRFEKKFRDRCDKEGIPSNLFIDTSPFYTVCHLSEWYTDENILAKILKMDFKQTENIFKYFAERYQDNLMRGSDYPYISYPRYQWSYKENIDLLDTLDEELKIKISRKNALRFLWDKKIAIWPKEYE